MIKQVLHDNWTVRAVGDMSEVPSPLRGFALPARVPGCVHTDLMRAGKIDDPYHGRNEFAVRWIGQTDWEYRTTFDADAKLFDHERIDLACDGLDTVATITLNGSVVARTENMHRGYRFDVRPMLKRGANELVITFGSPVKYAEAMQRKLGRRPYVNGPAGPFNFIRKMACNFGWDWGPALPTSGIWRGVRLEGWSIARIAEVRPLVRHATAADFAGMIDGPPAGVNWYTGKPWSPADPLLFIDLHVRFEVTEAGRFRRPHHERDNVAASLNIKLLDANGTDVATITGTFGPTVDDIISIAVPDPKLWHPRGHGLQPLYTLQLELTSWGPDPKRGWLERVLIPRAARPKTYGDSEKRTDSARLDESSHRIGLSTVELDTSPDEIGAKFVLKVNDKPIFCKGFNWIPDDCFLDRATEPTRVRERIQQAVDAGANMLRVWGGGIYETDDFYDVCDELGVLVWQDFPFACATYPEEEPFKSEVEAEARYNVARLAHHPSLALWNGCNENIWGYRDWGWKDSDEVKGAAGGKRTWGLGYYLDLLPRIVKELDPSRPYWAASPWSGDPDPDHGIHPNADTHGNMHVWRPWFREDYIDYRQFAPRFCSEFGFQGPATYASIASVVPPECRDFGSLEMRHRQKSGDTVRDDGDRRNLRHLLRHFNLPGAQELLDALASPNPDKKVPYCGVEPLHPARTLPSTVNFDDLHYLLQLNQARALTLGVEWFRSRQPRCMGTLYWQLNDCWPGVTSWSCIDGDGRKKPLWYATRRFYEGYLPTIQPESDGSLSLYFINDTDETFAVRGMNAWRSTFEMEDLARQRVDCEIPPRSVGRVPLDLAVTTPGDPSREMIWFGDERNATWFFAPDRELNYPEPRFEARLDRTGDDAYSLFIAAHTLLRDVCVFVDRIDPDATISEQLVTLTPEDQHVFTIRSKRELTLEALTTPPVLQCANRFGRTP